MIMSCSLKLRHIYKLVRVKQTISWQFFFCSIELGGITKHLMTVPAKNSEFCSGCFPWGQSFKCLLTQCFATIIFSPNLTFVLSLSKISDFSCITSCLVFRGHSFNSLSCKCTKPLKARRNQYPGFEPGRAIAPIPH